MARRRRDYRGGGALLAVLGALLGFCSCRALAGDAAAVLEQPGSVSEGGGGPDGLPLQPRIASYRTAYGTQFSCGTTCLLIAGAYSTLVCSLLLLVCLVPLQQHGKPEDNDVGARIVFGDDDSKLAIKKSPPETTERERGCWERFAIWIASIVLPHGAVVHDEEDIYEHFRGEYESVTQALAEKNGQKTYESIGIATDESLSPHRGYRGFGGPDDVMVIDDPERLFDNPPQYERGRSKRGSIFSNAPSPPPTPTPKHGRRSTRMSIASPAAAISTPEPSFLGQPAASPVLDITPDFIEQHRRMTLTGYQLAPSETKEDMVRAIEKRASIQHRAEKRKTLAKSDISYENLRDEEIQMYEYLEFVRQLLEGISLKKVCQSSTKVVKRTFFVSNDMSSIFWNKVANKKWMSRKSSIQVSAIERVLKGLDGNLGLASRGADPQKSNLYVSILCSDGKRLDLEAKDEAARQRLYLGFTRLAQEKRQSEQASQPPDAPSSVPVPETKAAATAVDANEPAQSRPSGPGSLSLVMRSTQRSPSQTSQLDLVMEEEEEKDDEQRG